MSRNCVSAAWESGHANLAKGPNRPGSPARGNPDPRDFPVFLRELRRLERRDGVHPGLPAPPTRLCERRLRPPASPAAEELAAIPRGWRAFRRVNGTGDHRFPVEWALQRDAIFATLRGSVMPLIRLSEGRGAAPPPPPRSAARALRHRSGSQASLLQGPHAPVGDQRGRLAASPAAPGREQHGRDHRSGPAHWHGWLWDVVGRPGTSRRLRMSRNLAPRPVLADFGPGRPYGVGECDPYGTRSAALGVRCRLHGGGP